MSHKNDFPDDWAPAKAKSRWFAFFYLCIPVGFALGYITGGLITAVASWRWSFVLEACAMIPFVIFAATSEPLRLNGSTQAHTSRGQLLPQKHSPAALFYAVDLMQIGGPP